MKQPGYSRHVLVVLLVAFLLASVVFETAAVVKAKPTRSVSPFALTALVSPNGTYTLTAQAPAWTFGGKIGHPLTNITTTTGSDNIDSYQETDFNYIDKTGASRGGGIRTYDDQPSVMFIDSYLAAASNNSPFPHLTTYPQNLYHLTYRYAFAQPTFQGYGVDSPWLFFDAQANTFG
jgi:hypothetical protein